MAGEVGAECRGLAAGAGVLVIVHDQLKLVGLALGLEAARRVDVVDGKLDATKPWKGGIAKNDFDVLIGENAEQKGRFFDGLIDDVRIYNYALKEVDIMALYNEGVKK